MGKIKMKSKDPKTEISLWFHGMERTPRWLAGECGWSLSEKGSNGGECEKERDQIVQVLAGQREKQCSVLRRFEPIRGC